MLRRLQRLLSHRWRDAANAQRTLTPAAAQRLRQQVAASEQGHSGEIRIYVEAGLPLRCLWQDAPLAALIRQRALALFGQLGVWDTAGSNGVLIYLLLAEHAIEIVADRGLNQQVAPAVWQALIGRMSAAFQRGNFEQGLTLAVAEVSALLHQHFPLAAGEANPNELPDAPALK